MNKDLEERIIISFELYEKNKCLNRESMLLKKILNDFIDSEFKLQKELDVKQKNMLNDYRSAIYKYLEHVRYEYFIAGFMNGIKNTDRTAKIRHIKLDQDNK